jgi:hypothetical protein
VRPLTTAVVPTLTAGLAVKCRFQRQFRRLVTTPRVPEIDQRKQRFEVLNELVRSRHGWLTSVPGDIEVTMETLVGSPLPDELRRAGYEVTEIDTTQRILTHAVVQDFVIGAGGQMELATAGSTRPVTQTTTHAGIVATTVYELTEPTGPPALAMRIVP